MSKRAIVSSLAKVPLLSGCTQRELSHLAEGTEVVEVPAKAPVVVQEDHGQGVFVLLDGAARVVRNGRTVATLGPGSHFGELALLDPGPRTASVVTTAAIGWPLPIGLPRVTISGTTPCVSCAHMWLPTRPKPTCTSSARHSPPAARTWE